MSSYAFSLKHFLFGGCRSYCTSFQDGNCVFEEICSSGLWLLTLSFIVFVASSGYILWNMVKKKQKEVEGKN